uniref:Amino acid transporter transmembrane domain-containing protein n=1 Tax=Acrobeloides nanus TaxID=290746 RepID=A0A914EHN2_9BILA
MASYGTIESPGTAIIPVEQEEVPISRSIDHFLIPSVREARQSSNIPTSDSAPQFHRRPYLFSPDISRNASSHSLISAQDSSITPVDIHREHNMAIRYRFFNRLDPGGTRLIMPEHVIPPSLFSVLPFDEFKDQEGKQGSLVTIFSIWNTMMGTSLLAMPWALNQAGLVFGIFLMLAMAFIAVYTAYRVVQSPQNLTMPVDSAQAEFSDVCRYFWGKKGEYISVFFSIVVLLGGVIVYWVLMSNFLFYTGNIFYESLQPNSTILPIMVNNTYTCDILCPTLKPNESLFYSEEGLFYAEEGLMMPDWPEESLESSSFFNFKNLWKLQGTVPIYLLLLTFPLMNLKSPTFFTKFNMYHFCDVFVVLRFDQNYPMRV